MINIMTTSVSLPIWIAVFLVAISVFTSALSPFSPPPRIFFDFIPAEIYVFIVVVSIFVFVFVVIVAVFVVVFDNIC